jgi:hypothetical protein
MDRHDPALCPPSSLHPHPIGGIRFPCPSQTCFAHLDAKPCSCHATRLLLSQVQFMPPYSSKYSSLVRTRWPPRGYVDLHFLCGHSAHLLTDPSRGADLDIIDASSDLPRSRLTDKLGVPQAIGSLFGGGWIRCVKPFTDNSTESLSHWLFLSRSSPHVHDTTLGRQRKSAHPHALRRCLFRGC